MALHRAAALLDPLRLDLDPRFTWLLATTLAPGTRVAGASSERHSRRWTVASFATATWLRAAPWHLGPTLRGQTQLYNLPETDYYARAVGSDCD